ncbi:MAG TPA: hypothetical protein VKR61_15390 [Bryobacteraceae bacterium]|nr:hypothetical protein [Bryobacteraceae bacterium]
MRILWTALLVSAIASYGARAETNQQKGKRIVDQAVSALGGQAFLSMRNRVESGRIYGFYHEKLSGLGVSTLYTQYSPRTASPEGSLGLRVRDARGKKLDDVYLYGDGLGFEITFRGARPLADAVVNQFKLGTLHNIFYILRQRLEEPGMIFESRGSDFYENRPVEIVDITDSNNDLVTVYFDQSTRLPTWQHYYRKDPIDNEKLEEVTIFGKYREVSGVVWPFTIRRERNGEKVFEMYSESVEINKDLQDSLFTLPPGLKILKKDK